jgi:hypothetical protein
MRGFCGSHPPRSPENGLLGTAITPRRLVFTKDFRCRCRDVKGLCGGSGARGVDVLAGDGRTEKAVSQA